MRTVILTGSDPVTRAPRAWSERSGARNGVFYWGIILLVLAVVGCSTASPPVAPTAATLSSVAPGDSQVTATWSSSSGATSYNLYYAQGATVTTATGTKISGVSSPNTVTSLTNGKQYAFLVTAVNSAGESPASNVLATPVGVAPRIVQVTYTSTSAGAYSFTTVSGATSYNLYYAAGSTVTTSSGTKVPGYTVGYQVPSLTTGIQYAMTLTAVYAGGEGPAGSVATVTPSASPAISFYGGLTSENIIAGTPVPGSPVSATLDILNPSGTTLNGLSSSITYTGGPTGWVTVGTLPLSITGGATDSSTPISFTPPGSLSGSATATITLSGTGAASQSFSITITESTTNTQVGSFLVSPSVANGATYDFGTVTAGISVNVVIFSLSNNSGSVTTGSPFVASLSAPFINFPITANGAPIGLGSNAYFGVVFSPGSSGAASPQTVTATWTGGTGSPYGFTVKGTGD